MNKKLLSVVADNKIPGLAESLSSDFDLELLSLEAITTEALKNADVLIGRSVLKVNKSLLENTKVRVVATCSSGTDHIDTNYLTEKGITYFSAPGSNAQGVADYVLWMLAYCAKRNITLGKKAGIIGMGHVGTNVHSVLKTLGFDVIVNDPPKAQIDPSFISKNLEEIAQCDLICVHSALTKGNFYPTYHLLSDDWWSKVKEKTVFINASRGAVVDTSALLKQKKDIYLCVDVFEDEPNINENLIKQCLMVTPHIAGHTVESFQRATQMIADQIHHYFGIFNRHLSTLDNFAVSSRNEAFENRSLQGVNEDSKRVNDDEIKQKNQFRKMSNSVCNDSEDSAAMSIIDASDCYHWHDVILKCYNFCRKVELTKDSFYTLRNTYRNRHDFSAMQIKNVNFLSDADRLLLQKLHLNLKS